MKRLRTASDLTQEHLAEEVGCAVQTIRTFEAGTRRPSRDMAARLAEVLQVPQEQRADFVRLARAPSGRPPAGRSLADVRQPPVSAGNLASPAGRSDATAGSGAVQPGPILATKLYVPQPRAALVARPGLRERLERGLDGPLTVIAAPAGFGKTTLLADWLASSPRPRQVAWLSLDAADSDPRQFLRYLVAAFQTIAPAAGHAALAVLQSAQPPPLETLMPVVANDLVQAAEGCVLVLDDYHTIDGPAVHQVLAYLLDHLPPQLHLVIATRVDPPLPLARLRARGQLTELRAHDLRFTPAEAAQFLQEVMGLPLTVADVMALEARTEGWIAGLQLAALTLQNRPREQMADFIDAFTGSHRFVVDYLVDEVLARQPGHLLTFLLQTSILERLSGGLCDAVVLGDASGLSSAAPSGGQAYSQLILEQLERSNLFIVPLDDDRHWYRYHHLFAQVLRERLASGASQNMVASLHRRASGWFEGQGLIVEAVQHALAAHDWERAASLIEAHGLLLMVRGEVHTVLAWLDMLPDMQLRARPFLFVIQALGLLFTNQLEAVDARLQDAEQRVVADASDDHSRTILGFVALLRGDTARTRGEITRCVILSQRALEILPATQEIARRAASLNLAYEFLVNGNVAPRNEHLLREAARSYDTGDLVAALRGVVTLADFQRRKGRLHQAATTYREAAGIPPEPLGLRALINGASYYFGLGDLLRERNELGAAQDLLRQGREMVLAGLNVDAEPTTAGYRALARLQQVRGESNAALATLAELQEVAQQRTFAPHLLTRVAAARAHLALLQGDLPAATRWADSSGLHVHDELTYLHECEYLTLARIRIAQSRSGATPPHLSDTLHFLHRLMEDAETGSRMDSLIEIVVLRALALHKQGELNAALAALEHALVLAAPEGYVRVFVDEGAPMASLLAQAPADAYAEKLLAVLRAEGIDPAAVPHTATSTSLASPPKGEQLTERELEVLRLLAAGRSNQAVASELIVAVGTVKRHVNSILSKLGVESRLEAVARARDLGLV